MFQKLAGFLCVVFVFSGLSFAQDTVKLDVVMNFYNNKSAVDVKNAVLIKNRFGSKVQLNVIPFVVWNSKTKNLLSQFGQADFEESKTYLAVKNNYPSNVNDYLLATMNGSNWQEASVYAGLSPKKVRSISQKNGDTYMKKEYDFLQAKKIKNNSTILINSKVYTGDRDLSSLMTHINSQLSKDKRIYISKDKIKFRMYVVEHETLPQGKEDKQLTQNISQYVKMQADVERVPYSKAMRKFKGIDIDFLPLYIIEKDVNITSLFETSIQRGTATETDKYIVLGKSTREGVFAGRDRKENLLEIFVMSQCPYGVMAENAVIASLNEGTFPKDVKVRIRYIASENGDGFNSLHGQPEWEENVRQLIIQDLYPDKFYKYLFHRNKEYQTDKWQDAAKKAGINPAKVTKDFERGKDLLRADIKYSDSYGASASPTLLWEGQLLTNMRDITKLEKFKNFNPQASPDKAPTGSCG